MPLVIEVFTAKNEDQDMRFATVDSQTSALKSRHLERLVLGCSFQPQAWLWSASFLLTCHGGFTPPVRNLTPRISTGAAQFTFNSGYEAATCRIFQQITRSILIMICSLHRKSYSQGTGPLSKARNSAEMAPPISELAGVLAIEAFSNCSTCEYVPHQ